MIFEQILDVEKILLGDVDILTKLHTVKTGNIVLAKGDNQSITNDINEYAEIISVGKGITDPRFALGNIIIAANEGRGNKSFPYKKDKYVILSAHTVGIVVTPDNFKPTVK